MDKKDIQGKLVVVMGAGKSGVAAVKLLSAVGAKPVIYDENEQLDKEALLTKIAPYICDIYAGCLPEEVKKTASILVMSPGIPVDTPFVDGFKALGIPVWGEIELAYQFAKGRIIGITGTNGKTTTTALTGKIIADFFGKSFVVGNIGDPYTDAALDTEDSDVTVAEISSFQLETAVDFHPQVSAILNITPDHLNRHHTMENYVACKQDITKNQTKSDVCVLNYEDEYLRAFGQQCPARVVWFSSKTVLKDGFYQVGDVIYRAVDGESISVMNIHEMKLLGTHNVENVMAAMAMTEAFDIPIEKIVASVKEFNAVEHRIEYVATVDGVDYYNDSKGTNPDAAIKGIQAMNRPTVLIGGGYDKQNTYDEWIESFDGKVTYLILIGQTREKIKECALAHGFENIILADTFEECMNIAREKAEPGQAVLLSPACASWGMFPNYEVRGKDFKRIVHGFEAK